MFAFLPAPWGGARMGGPPRAHVGWQWGVHGGTHSQGNQCFKAKNYAQAIAYYTEAIELDGTVPAYFSNRSACHAGMQNWAAAADDGRNCIRVDRNFIKGYFRLATALEGAVDNKGAVDALTMGLAIEPRNRDLNGMKSRLEEALRRERSQALLERTEKLMSAGDIPGAFKTIEQARAIDSANTAVQSLFDSVSAAYERHEKQRRAGLSGLDRIKEQGDDKYKSSMFEEAIALYTQCIDGSSDRNSDLVVKALSNRAACYKQLSNFDNVIEDCTAVIEIDEQNVKAYVRRAQAFEAIEKYKSALQDCKFVISMGMNVAGLQNYKLCNQMQGRLKPVIERLKAGDF